MLTIVCMLGLMFWLNWDFTLIAVAVTPFLLLFVSRFKKAVKSATHEVRKEQSQIVAVVQQGLESMQVVKAFGQERTEEEILSVVSQATVAAALKARSVKALLSPVVTVMVAICTAIVLWRGAALILAGSMTVGSLTVYLAYLTRFFKPVKDLATTTNAIAQVAVGVERVREILDTDTIIPEKPDGLEPETLQGAIELRNVAFGYDPANPILTDVSFTHQTRRVRRHRRPHRRRQVDRRQPDPPLLRHLSGNVLIDGHDVRDYKIKPLRDQIGYVLQETVLFRGTILENIAFGAPAPPATRSSPPQSSPTPTSSSPECRSATTPSLANADQPSPEDSASESASPASWSATTPSCFSMSPPPPSTANPKSSSSTPSKS